MSNAPRPGAPLVTRWRGLRRLRAGLPLLLLLGLALLASAVFWMDLLQRQEQQTLAARQRSEWRVRQLNAAVSQQIDAQLLSLDIALKHLHSVYLHNPRDFDEAARDLLASYPPGMLPYVIVFGRDGQLLYTSTPELRHWLGLSFADREHFRVHAAALPHTDALFVSAPFAGRLIEGKLVQLTRGMWEGGEFRGVIGIPVLPGYLSGRLVSLQVDATDILAVVRPDGSTIARSHNLDEALKSKLPPDRPFLQAGAAASGLFRSTSTFDRVPMLFSWQRLAQWPLITVAAINEDAEMAPMLSAMALERQHALLTIAMGTAFSAGVALLVMRVQGQNRGLARSEAEQRAILNSEISGIVKLKGRRFVWMNRAFAAMLGYPAEELIGKSTRVVYPDDASYTAMGYTAYPAMQEGAVYRSEVQYRRKDGTLAWFDVSGDLLRAHSDESIWSFADISERKHIEDQVRHIAFHDALTRLPNRRLLVDRMRQTLAACKRSGRFAALMFLDLDNFKPLNDLHGHDVGDLLLIEVAERLRQCVREIDTVARFGGDEFVVMLSDLHADPAASHAQAATVAEKMRLALAEPYHLRAVQVQGEVATVTHHCTASIGVALFTAHEGSEEDILNRADAAMYAAKHGGRNRVCFAEGRR